ncbi:mCG147077 [Mus musculus]|nr:mCG147077 [Mus musculus]
MDSTRAGCSYECLLVSMVDRSGFASRRFRLNMAYKIRILEPGMVAHTFNPST